MARYNHTDVQIGDVVKSDVNQRLQEIETAIDSMLSREADVPNSMESDLDLNSNDILNVNAINGQSLTLGGISVTPGQITGIENISEAADTSIVNPIANQGLVWNGSAWVNQQLDYNDLANLPSIPDVSGKADSLFAINEQTGTTYTLQNSDLGKIITMNNANPITVTVPSTLPLGFNCELVQTGVGQITVAAGASATLISADDLVASRTGSSVISVQKVKASGNVYLIGGDLA